MGTLSVAQDNVREFHKAFDVVTCEHPTMPDKKTLELRCLLLEEETVEFRDAASRGSFTDMVDALADIIYVALGASITLGVDLSPVWDEVHRSNMSKVGGHKSDTGKWVKPDTYSPADIETEIIKQFGEGQHSVLDRV